MGGNSARDRRSSKIAWLAGRADRPGRAVDLVLSVERIDDRVKLDWIRGRRHQDRRQLHLLLAFREGLDFADRIIGMFQFGEQKLAHIGDIRRHGDHMDPVQRLGYQLIHRLAVDVIDQRTQQGIPGQDEHGQHHRLDRQARTGEGADRGGTPERGGSIEPAHIRPLLHDHAGTEEADAGDDIGDDPRRAVRPE